MAQTYRDWLKDREYKVTPEQHADHRHMLAAVDPVEKGLERLMHDFGVGETFEGGAKFNREELETLRAAHRILQGVEIPVALLQVEQKPGLRFKNFRGSYDRRGPEKK